ncbi:MAG: GNAT family N-acetyltransferase, partial [Atribacterota bacterium]
YRSCFFDKTYITKKKHLEWYENYRNKSNDMFFVVYLDGEPVGTISLYNIKDKCAEIGRTIMTVKGIGYKVKNAIIKWGFSQLYINKIYSNVVSTNKKSINLNKKLGFEILSKNSNVVNMVICNE